MAERPDAELSHIAGDGSAHMVDVSGKAETLREAVAAGEVRIGPDAMALVRAGRTAKGDAVETARIAGILAAKRTASLIPMCHPLGLDHVDVDVDLTEDGVEIVARATSRGRTGVEMEALTAVSVTALTIYDMVKSADKAMVIGNIRLLRKSGGKSGEYRRRE